MTHGVDDTGGEERCRTRARAGEETTGSEDGPRRSGPALKSMCGLTLWLMPALERFPRRQKFLLGDRIHTTAPASPDSLAEAMFTRRRSRLLNRVNADLDRRRLVLRLAKDLS